MNTIYHMEIPVQFADLRAFLNGRTTRKSAHNTQIVDLGDTIICEFHGLTIIRYSDTGITIDNCGYETSTTRDRFNHLAPCRAYQDKYLQYLVTGTSVRKFDRSANPGNSLYPTIGNWLNILDGESRRLRGMYTFAWPVTVQRYKLYPGTQRYGGSWLDANGNPAPDDRTAEAVG